MTRKQRRLTSIGVLAAVLGISAGLILYAFNDSIVFFYGPTEVAQKGVQPGARLRIGGLVKEGSVQRGADQTIRFDVTDGNSSIVVRYRGLLPDLFREGQGVVTEGVLQPGGEFRADSVLAKHDENYMPKEVADSLRKQGVWQGGDGKAGAPK